MGTGRWGSGLARALVGLAVRLAPPDSRERMRREWEAELEATREARGGVGLARAALGAFADAWALRGLASTGEGRRPAGGAAEGVAGWARDGKVAVRSLLRTPGFTVVAVLTLAIGIGGSAAIWTVLKRVALDPLPYPEAERLVSLQNQVPGVAPGAVWRLSTAQWVAFEEASTLSAVAIYGEGEGNVLTPGGPRVARSVVVTASLMPLLGARARVGRVIAPADDLPAASPVALLSHGFWVRELGADAGVVGRTLTLDDQPVEVIGVLEPDVELPGSPLATAPELWRPMRVDPAARFWNDHQFKGVGRLAPDVTREDAEAEIARLTAGFPERFPDAYSQGFFDRYGFRTTVSPLKTTVVGSAGEHLWLLFGAMTLVLLIACANVTNLFLIRIDGRRRELSIRSALGAGRGAVARYLVAEGLALSLAGGVLALVIGYWAVPGITAMAPREIPRIHGVGMDGGTIFFALGLSLLVGLGLAAHPLLAHTGPGAASRLAAGRSSTAGRDRQRVRSLLVVLQVAVALTLIVGAGLLVETLRALSRTDTGVDPEGVIAVRLSPSYPRHPSDTALWMLYGGLLERVRAMPGVVAAGMTGDLPVRGAFGCVVQGFDDEAVGARLREAGLTSCAGQQATTPGYFEAMGIPLVEGRLFADADNDDPSRAVAIVSRAFAARFWPGQSALGQRVAPNGRTDSGFHTVVGVVGDVPRRTGEAGEARVAPLSQPAIAVYYPIVETPDLVGRWGWWPGGLHLVVKSGRGDPGTLIPEIRRAAAELDPDMPLHGATDMETVIAEAMAGRAFLSLLLGIAAGVALLLAAVGLYGVVSYVVARRTREIGMRMAIGARPGEVLRLVVGRSLVLTGAGLLAGVLLSLAATRLLEGVLVGVEPTDPSSFAGAAAVLATVALLASWIPARRAARIDPAEALRAE